MDECLLGLDFLASQEAQVNLRDNILYLCEEEVLPPRNRGVVSLSRNREFGTPF